MLRNVLSKPASSSFLSPLSAGVSSTSTSAAAALCTTAVRHFGGEMRHVDTERNNSRIPWDFTLESYKEIDRIMATFPRSRRRSGVLPLLHLAQRQNGGWIPVTAQYKIAKICEVPPMTVFEVVTFYAMYNRRPVNKFHLQFCVTTPCMLRGCDELIHWTEHHLGIPMGGSTADGLFTIGEMECMGCCVNAPMVVVSDYSNAPKFSYDFYEDLDEKSMEALLVALKNGTPTRVGSQLKNRKWSEPEGGKTTLLFKEPPGPFCRDLNAKPEPKK